MITKTLDTQCGIYNTNYTLTVHDNGSISIKIPYLRGNCGTLALAFYTKHFDARKASQFIAIFDGTSEQILTDLIYQYA